MRRFLFMPLLLAMAVPAYAQQSPAQTPSQTPMEQALAQRVIAEVQGNLQAAAVVIELQRKVKELQDRLDAAQAKIKDLEEKK